MSRPLILGHRGARAYAPMNTMAAFQLAFDQGADGIELDVWLTADGIPVILHDEHVDATTNGRGPIRELTLAQIKRLDAGGWFAEPYQGERVPELDAVLGAFPGRLINIEIKSPGDRDWPDSDGIESAVADLIDRHHTANDVIVSSFSLETLKRFHARAPAVAIGYLYATEHPLDDPFLGRCQYVHPFHELLSSQSMRSVSQWQVNTWTVNDPERALELDAMGVHALITDTPDVLLAAFV